MRRYDPGYATLKSTVDSGALGAPLLPFLATGADASRWRRWQSEMQMLWFEHAINRRRFVECCAAAGVGSALFPGALAAVAQDAAAITPEMVQAAQHIAGVAFTPASASIPKRSAIFVSRFIDNNNEDNGDPIRFVSTGRDGIEIRARNVGVVTLQDGRIIRWRLCRDRAEALKAVGLEE